jgi:thymidylate synthase (FAD)
MKIVSQKIEILTEISPNAEKELALIEKAGRTCYKSEAKNGDSTEKFIRRIIKLGHESVLEHSLLTVKFITSRSISHQLVRHRLAAFSQESQRYCNYSKEQFGSEIQFIQPISTTLEEFQAWKNLCALDEQEYIKLVRKGVAPEIARSVLPNCTKTEIVMSTNYREWRHVLKERTSKRADPNMRSLMRSLLRELQERIPVIFEDIEI